MANVNVPNIIATGSRVSKISEAAKHGAQWPTVAGGAVPQREQQGHPAAQAMD
jgi:hypothetical protein